MLSSAKIVLKNEIFKILQSEDTKNALKNALLTTFPADCRDEFNDIAETFGKVGAGYLGYLATPLADAIDKYVRQIGIQINIPPTVTSPHGPCGGVINPTDVIIL